MVTQLSLYFLLATSQYHLPAELLSSICYTESKYNVTAVHVDDGTENSVGVCQIHPSTARWLGFKGTEHQLMDPKTNILYAGRFLSYQLKRYHNDATKAVIAYNYGHAPKELTSTKYQVRVFTRWGNSNVQKWSTCQMH